MKFRVTLAVHLFMKMEAVPRCGVLRHMDVDVQVQDIQQYMLMLIVRAKSYGINYTRDRL